MKGDGHSHLETGTVRILNMPSDYGFKLGDIERFAHHIVLSYLAENVRNRINYWPPTPRSTYMCDDCKGRVITAE